MEERLLSDNYGVVSRTQLLETGLGGHDIQTLTETGRLTRLRPGWFASDPADAEVVRAVRAGGVLSCVSALRRHGLWVPPDPLVHLRCSEHHTGRPLSPGLKECQPRPQCRRRMVRSVDPFLLALRTAVSCVPDDVLVVLLDSALRQGRLERGDLPGLWPTGSDRALPLINRVDPSAESGTETLVRLRLRRRGIRVRTQFQIGAVGRVDLLIGDRLVIEVDSRAHHTGVEAYRRDRRRDRRLVGLGYVVIRLAYEDVLFDWDEAEEDILAVIRSRRHRWPRRRA